MMASKKKQILREDASNVAPSGVGEVVAHLRRLREQVTRSDYMTCGHLCSAKPNDIMNIRRSVDIGMAWFSGMVS